VTQFWQWEMLLFFRSSQVQKSRKQLALQLSQLIIKQFPETSLAKKTATQYFSLYGPKHLKPAIEKIILDSHHLLIIERPSDCNFNCLQLSILCAKAAGGTPRKIGWGFAAHFPKPFFYL